MSFSNILCASKDVSKRDVQETQDKSRKIMIFIQIWNFNHKFILTCEETKPSRKLTERKRTCETVKLDEKVYDFPKANDPRDESSKKIFDASLWSKERPCLNKHDIQNLEDYIS